MVYSRNIYCIMSSDWINAGGGTTRYQTSGSLGEGGSGAQLIPALYNGVIKILVSNMIDATTGDKHFHLYADGNFMTVDYVNLEVGTKTSVVEKTITEGMLIALVKVQGTGSDVPANHLIIGSKVV